MSFSRYSSSGATHATLSEFPRSANLCVFVVCSGNANVARTSGCSPLPAERSTAFEEEPFCLSPSSRLTRVGSSGHIRKMVHVGSTLEVEPGLREKRPRALRELAVRLGEAVALPVAGEHGVHAEPGFPQLGEWDLVLRPRGTRISVFISGSRNPRSGATPYVSVVAPDAPDRRAPLSAVPSPPPPPPPASARASRAPGARSPRWAPPAPGRPRTRAAPSVWGARGTSAAGSAARQATCLRFGHHRFFLLSPHPPNAAPWSWRRRVRRAAVRHAEHPRTQYELPRIEPVLFQRS